MESDELIPLLKNFLFRKYLSADFLTFLVGLADDLDYHRLREFVEGVREDPKGFLHGGEGSRKAEFDGIRRKMLKSGTKGKGVKMASGGKEEIERGKRDSLGVVKEDLELGIKFTSTFGVDKPKSGNKGKRVNFEGENIFKTVESDAAGGFVGSVDELRGTADFSHHQDSLNPIQAPRDSKSILESKEPAARSLEPKLAKHNSADAKNGNKSDLKAKNGNLAENQKKGLFKVNHRPSSSERPHRHRNYHSLVEPSSSGARKPIKVEKTSKNVSAPKTAEIGQNTLPSHSPVTNDLNSLIYQKGRAKFFFDEFIKPFYDKHKKSKQKRQVYRIRRPGGKPGTPSHLSNGSKGSQVAGNLSKSKILNSNSRAKNNPLVFKNYPKAVKNQSWIQKMRRKSRRSTSLMPEATRKYFARNDSLDQNPGAMGLKKRKRRVDVNCAVINLTNIGNIGPSCFSEEKSGILGKSRSPSQRAFNDSIIGSRAPNRGRIHGVSGFVGGSELSDNKLYKKSKLAEKASKTTKLDLRAEKGGLTNAASSEKGACDHSFQTYRSGGGFNLSDWNRDIVAFETPVRSAVGNQGLFVSGIAPSRSGKGSTVGSFKRLKDEGRKNPFE